MVRKNYEGLDIELIMFEKADVITASYTSEDDETDVVSYSVRLTQ